MMTIDELLHLVVDHEVFLNNNKIDQKTKKTLVSLSRQAKKGFFFTEKQGKLVCNLLDEVQKEPTISKCIDFSCLTSKFWSSSFRVIDIQRNIYFEDDKKVNFVVDFNYDKDLKKKIFDVSKKTNGNNLNTSGCRFIFSATEKNIALVLDTLAQDKFVIDENLQNLYQEIKKIQETGAAHLDLISNQNDKIIDCIKNELTTDNIDLDLLLLDRRIRYQYTFEPKKIENSLSFKIANRKNTQVWIDKNKVELENVIDSLAELQRLPVLLVFSKHDIKSSYESLKKFKKSIEKYENFQVGIYFRADNSNDLNKEFNTFIGESKFNKFLEPTTDIVGITATNLPKFMLKTNWYPKSVISFTNSFKHNKSFVYCNCVDLVLYYTDHSHLAGELDEIL